MLNYVSNNQPEFKGKPPAVYIGFDPTAPSIHLGNFMGLMALAHFRIAGFKPIVLFGGATGLIGDPSGRSTERQLLSEDTISQNICNFEAQFKTLDQNI
jgi:tyrosyl-tRNA synthetase